MADFLAVYGQQNWVRLREVPNECLFLTEDDGIPEGLALRLAFQGGRVPYRGEWHRQGDIVFAWVGELRNNSELARLLDLNPSTHPASLITTGWLRHGSAIFERCHGVVAAVLWDRRTKLLHCFRDKMGLAPVQYALDAGCGVIVSTNSDWLLQCRNIDSRPNFYRLSCFLQNTNGSGDSDFVQGVYRVRPREHVCWNSRLRAVKKFYWTPETSYLSVDTDFSGRVRTLLEDIQSSLVGLDRVVAMSGGLDSQSLAAIELNQKRLESGSSNVRIPVASMIAPGFEFTDESLEIDAAEKILPIDVFRFSIADHWSLRHTHYYRASHGSGPFPIPEADYFVAFAQAVKENFGEVSLILGRGADHIFSVSAELYIRRLLATGAYDELVAIMKPYKPRKVAFIGRQIAVLAAENLHIKPYLRYLRTIRQPDTPACPHWLNSCDSSYQIGVEQRTITPSSLLNDLHNHYGKIRLEGMLQSWTWEYASRAVQRYSRAAQIPVVCPYIDDRLWEFGLRIPPEVLMQRGMNKAVLRHAVHDLLPDEIVSRPKHSQFDAIIEYGLGVREVHQIEQLFMASRLVREKLIDFERFHGAYNLFCQRNLDKGLNHDVQGGAIWRAISAELWLQQF